MSKTLLCGRFQLTLDRPLIMGVLNVTPDSFSDGGRYFSPESALEQAKRLVDEGADILDIGGESTRPGAAVVSVQQEMDRVLPLLEVLQNFPIPISLDSRRPEVMSAALRLGIDMINDVNALEAEGAIEAVLDHPVALCLMHKQGEPATMQERPHYQDVVDDVVHYLFGRANAVVQAGVSPDRIVLDPGFGFGKSLNHNLALLRDLSRLKPWAILAGLSRKSMLGQITGQPVEERVYASVAAALLAVQRGAHIVRVHDVAATCDVLKVYAAVENPERLD